MTHIISFLFSENRPDEDNLVFVTQGPIYPYSTQKLNSTENALEQMRTYLKQVWWNILNLFIFKWFFFVYSIIVQHHVHLILNIHLIHILHIQMKKQFSIFITNFVHHLTLTQQQQKIDYQQIGLLIRVIVQVFNQIFILNYQIQLDSKNYLK